MIKVMSRTAYSGTRHNCIDPSNRFLLFGGARDSIFGSLNTAATLSGNDLLRTFLTHFKEACEQLTRMDRVR